MWVSLYKLTNRFNGKEYIGITSCKIKERFSRHVYSTKRGSNSRLHRAMRKYGIDAFDLELLCKVDSAKVALKLETKLIKQFDTLWPNGYNALAVGGVSLGYKYTAEQRRHISESVQGRIPWNKGKTFSDEEKARLYSKEWRKKQSARLKGKPAWNKGIPASKEWRDKLSKAHKRRYKDPEERRKTGESSRKFWSENPEAAVKMGRKIRKIRAKRFWSSRKKTTKKGL